MKRELEAAVLGSGDENSPLSERRDVFTHNLTKQLLWGRTDVEGDRREVAKVGRTGFNQNSVLRHPLCSSSLSLSLCLRIHL